MAVASTSQPRPSFGKTRSIGAPLSLSLAARYSKEIPTGNSPAAACLQGLDPEWVFPYGNPGGPVHRMNDSAWKKARVRAADKWEKEHKTAAHPGFRSIRVHDLKHSFGRRLRAAGVTEEDRKALLGHKNGSITSHYSAAELDQLIDAANKVSVTDSRAPALTILKRRQI